MGELPPKLFYRIGEVAGLVGVEPHVLRYWEREFRSIRPAKSAKGQRIYSRKDVENLLRVRDLLYRDGFTIAGAKKKLHRGHEEEPETELKSLEEQHAPEAILEGEADIVSEASAEPEAQRADEPNDPAEKVRARLLTLRQEIEGFLVELSPPPRR